MMSSRPSTSRALVAETTITSTLTTTSSLLTPEYCANLLYCVESEECYNNRDYQHRCIKELYGRIFAKEGSPANLNELLGLMQALSVQLPDFKPPLPAYFTPIIRFDAGKVPFFEFHCFSKSLPMTPGLTGVVGNVRTVDDFICNYSKAIFQSMMAAHFVWTEQKMMQKNMFQSFQTTVHTQETAESSGFNDSFSAYLPKKTSRSRESADFTFDLSPISAPKSKSGKELQLQKSVSLPKKRSRKSLDLMLEASMPKSKRENGSQLRKSPRLSLKQKEAKAKAEVNMKKSIQAPVKRGRGRPPKRVSL